jgi:hypothetical protein
MLGAIQTALDGYATTIDADIEKLRRGVRGSTAWNTAAAMLGEKSVLRIYHSMALEALEILTRRSYGTVHQWVEYERVLVDTYLQKLAKLRK